MACEALEEPVGHSSDIPKGQRAEQLQNHRPSPLRSPGPGRGSRSSIFQEGWLVGSVWFSWGLVLQTGSGLMASHVHLLRADSNTGHAAPPAVANVFSETPEWVLSPSWTQASLQPHALVKTVLRITHDQLLLLGTQMSAGSQQPCFPLTSADSRALALPTPPVGALAGSGQHHVRTLALKARQVGNTPL